MTRSLTPAMAAEVDGTKLAPIVFIEADFASGFARMWNGVGPIVWDTKTWLGGGTLIGLGEMQETREITATALAVSLSGVDSALVATAYGDFSQGRPLKVWLGAMDMATGLVVDDPVAIFQGRMDTISDADDGTQATITVTAEAHLTDLKRVRARYLTDQDQQRLFPGDRSLRYMPSLQDRPVYWGVDGATPDLLPIAP